MLDPAPADGRLLFDSRAASVDPFAREGMVMPWWLWVLLGFGLLAGEVLTPGGFFFLFFGLGGIVVGALVWLGLAQPAWLQWLLFSLISLVCLVPLRGRLVRRIGGKDTGGQVDALVGEVAVLLDDLPPGEIGKAELRGTAWTARNTDQHALRRGQRGRVTRVDGLTLWLQAE
jgi:membrane protein implicated in regulation of membrane protease activity